MPQMTSDRRTTFLGSIVVIFSIITAARGDVITAFHGLREKAEYPIKVIFSQAKEVLSKGFEIGLKHILLWAFSTTSLVGSEPSLLEQAIAAEQAGQQQRAHQLYEQLPIQYPESAIAWAAWGESLRFRAHNHTQARAAFTRAIGTQYYDGFAVAFAYRGMGEIFCNEGQPLIGYVFYQQSLKLHRSVATLRSLSAWWTRFGNDRSQALLHAQQAISIHPNTKDPITLFQHAAQLQASNKPRNAAEYAATALGSMGGSISADDHCCAIYNAACFYALSGQHEIAITALKTFFANPDHRHLPLTELLYDPDFISLQSSPDFQALLQTMDTK